MLDIAINKEYVELVQLCINHPKLNLPSYDHAWNYQPYNITRALSAAMSTAIKRGNEKIVKILMASGKYKDLTSNENNNFYTVKNNHYDSLIKEAAKNNQKGIIHILKAYDTLKTDLDSKTLSLVDLKFYDAYQKFIDGNANDLRNLIFPVSKKVDSKKGTTTNIYAIFPKENSETAAINMISKSLVKLFKPGYIRSLILTLIETNAQKEAAQDLLEQMQLTKKDLKEFFKNKNFTWDTDQNKEFDFYSYKDSKDNDFYNHDFYNDDDDSDYYNF